MDDVNKHLFESTVDHTASRSGTGSVNLELLQLSTDHSKSDGLAHA